MLPTYHKVLMDPEQGTIERQKFLYLRLASCFCLGAIKTETQTTLKVGFTTSMIPSTPVTATFHSLFTAIPEAGTHSIEWRWLGDWRISPRSSADVKEQHMAKQHGMRPGNNGRHSRHKGCPKTVNLAENQRMELHALNMPRWCERHNGARVSFLTYLKEK